LTDVQARAQEAGKAEMSAEQIVSQANKLCPGGHKLCEYTTPHGEHSCDVCELPVAGQELLQRCDECDYDVCCICAAPTKVPTRLPTELLTDTPTELTDGQADGERTGSSKGLRHVDAREHTAKQTATTDEPTIDRMPCNLYGLPMVSYSMLAHSMLAQQDEQGLEAMLQNQQAHAQKQLQELKSQQAWLQQLQQQQEACLKQSRASATTTESAYVFTATAPQRPRCEAQDRASR
jgi:hypothetical protein